MNARLRTLLLLAITTTLLAACGTTSATSTTDKTGAQATPPPADSAAPSVEPSEAPAESAAPSVEPSAAPAESASAEREVAGTITVAEGMAFSGPGGTIQEALDIGPTGEYPTLVNGVLFRDTDGRVYLATAVSDATEPIFEGPMLLVLDYPDDGSSWDMANAALLGLEEANGIVFNPNSQILGYLEVH